MECQLDVCSPDKKIAWPWGPSRNHTLCSQVIEQVMNQESTQWMIFIYCLLLYCLYWCLRGRQERKRQRKLLHDYEKDFESERNAIEKLHLIDELGASHLAAKVLKSRATTEGPHFAPLSMCSIKEYGFGKSLFDKYMSQNIKGEHKRQDLTCLEGPEGCIVQTRVELSGDVLTRLHQVATEGTSSNKAFTMQLGKCQVYVKSRTDGEVKVLRLEDNDSVPVILHSSYVAGTLTVDGLHLKGADLVVATVKSRTTLETIYQKTVSGIEKLTCVVTLPSKHLDKVILYATKKIVAGEHEVHVNSLAMPIQDDNLKAALHDVLPLTIIVIYAAKQLLMTRLLQTRDSIRDLMWCLFPLLVIITTYFLPQSTEETTRTLLRKLCVRTSLMLYFAFWSLLHQHDCEAPCIINLPGECSSQSSDSGTKCSKCAGSEKDSDNQPKKCKADGGRSRTRDIKESAWQWPVFDTIYEKFGASKLVSRNLDTENELVKEAPFKVIHLNLKKLPWASQLQVEVYSPSLLKVIDKIIPKKADRWIKNKVILEGPELFRLYQELKEHKSRIVGDGAEPSSSGDTRGMEEMLHRKHFRRFMDGELSDIEEMYASMKSQRNISYNMLWAFFQPGERIVYPCNVTGDEVCGTVIRTYYNVHHQTGEFIFVIKLSVRDYNCKTWSEYSIKRSIPHFEGALPFKEMTVYPLHFKDDPQALKENFLSNGKLFGELSMQGISYRNYTGSIFITRIVDNCPIVFQENADGRVMIDLGSFYKMNPNYMLGNAKPPCEVIRENKVENLDIAGDDSRMFAPAIVYGFSFRLKQWGSFPVCGFSEILFNDSAFDTLVMDPNTKDLIESLVHEHLKDAIPKKQECDRVDPIPSKGEGCIILCYGPPGTGKTFTAESLSEKLQCPLWSLSVSELGTTPKVLESMLVKVMDVAAKWGALVLLDEADIYLERRTSSDLMRNAMTGIFLRHLEYYRGILFLTTNRDFAFDEAFCSRISMFLCYEKHNLEQRSEIWNNFISRLGIQNVSLNNVAEFANYAFNGREIRNVVQLAQTLARTKDQSLDAKHIRQSLKVLESSIKLRASLNSQTSQHVVCPNDMPSA